MILPLALLCICNNIFTSESNKELNLQASLYKTMNPSPLPPLNIPSFPITTQFKASSSDRQNQTKTKPTQKSPSFLLAITLNPSPLPPLNRQPSPTIITSSNSSDSQLYISSQVAQTTTQKKTYTKSIHKSRKRAQQSKRLNQALEEAKKQKTQNNKAQIADEVNPFSGERLQ